MAKKKSNLVMMVPEGQTRDNHDYHYIKEKTKKMVQMGEKLRLKKYNPVSRKHEYFIEVKMPPHSKN